MKKLLLASMTALGLAFSTGIAFAADATSSAELTSAVDTITDQLTANFWTVYVPVIGIIAIVFGALWVVGVVIKMLRKHAK
jgi:hypothetical protein